MMMEGITVPEFVRFLLQAGLAVAGAAAFWSVVFRMVHRNASPEYKEAYTVLCRRLFFLFLAGSALFFAAWWVAALVLFPAESFAHEGHRLLPAAEEIRNGFEATLPAVALSMFLGAAGLLAWRFRSALFWKHATPFFLIQFLLLSLVAFFSVHTGSFGTEQLFFALHGWHSFFTLGTVVVVDALYLTTIHRLHAKRMLYLFFPLMSAAIWFGLALDFTSVLLTFDGAFDLTSQFFFSQTVIAVIILNGALLSGRINARLVASVRTPAPVRIPERFATVMDISGSISIVSWFAVTFVDFFTLSASYLGLISLYVLAVAVAYAGHEIIEKVQRQRAPEEATIV